MIPRFLFLKILSEARPGSKCVPVFLEHREGPATPNTSPGPRHHHPRRRHGDFRNSSRRPDTSGRTRATPQGCVAPLHSLVIVGARLSAKPLARMRSVPPNSPFVASIPSRDTNHFAKPYPISDEGFGQIGAKDCCRAENLRKSISTRP